MTLRHLLPPATPLDHLIYQVKSNNSCLSQQLALGIERRERKQAKAIGRKIPTGMDQWLDDRVKDKGKCPSEGHNGTTTNNRNTGGRSLEKTNWRKIKYLIHAHGWSLFLNELNSSAGVKSCWKCSVGDLDAIGGEIPTAEVLGKLTERTREC